MRRVRLGITIGICSVALVIAFAVGVRSGIAVAGPKVDVFAGITPHPEVGEEVKSKLEVFWEAWEQVQTHYYRGPLEPQELVEGATRGMVRATGDDYTNWVDAETARMDRQRLEGEFEGIGATVDLTEEGFIKIVRPLPGSPAEEAGLKPDDLVIAVDGVATRGKSLRDLVREVRGPAGTTVVLTIKSADGTVIHDVRVVRRAIFIASVVSRPLDEFGYIRLTNFGTKTTDELRESIRKFRGDAVEGIILDLRNNPGGLLNTAVDVAGEFFSKGTLIVSERSREQDIIHFKSSRHGSARDIPVVVLINGGSASASEIVAGAIKDHGRGKLLGSATFGKGSVQIPFELQDQSVVRVTVAIWQTPGGTHLDGVGIQPDFNIDGDLANRGEDDDPYIEAAIRVLRGLPCCANLGRAA